MSEEKNEAAVEVGAGEAAPEQPKEPSNLDQLREAAAAKPQVANERGELKASAMAMSAASIAAAAADPGIQNSLEVVAFGVALVKAIAAAKANDGKFNLADVPLLFPIIPLIGPAVEDVGHIPAELGALDDAELEVLLEKASELLGGANRAATVLKVKAALKFANAGKDLFLAFKK